MFASRQRLSWICAHVQVICLAQGTYTANDISRHIIPIDLGAGSTLYIGERDLFPDSSYLDLFWTNEAEEVTSSQAYLGCTSFTSLVTAAKMGNGFLLGGEDTGELQSPFLLATDANGTVEWYGHFADLDYADEMFAVFGHENAWTAYAHPAGWSVADRLYRLDGDPSGSSLTGVIIANSAQINMRVHEVFRSDSVDMACGIIVDPTGSGLDDMLLIAMGPDGADWGKRYDLGTSGSAADEVCRQVVATAEGELICVGHIGILPDDVEAYFKGFVMKLTASGDPVWAVRLESPPGLLLTDVIELEDGDLLLYGYSNLEGRLIRMSGSGDVMWQKGFQSFPPEGSRDDHLWRNSIGQVKVAALSRLIVMDTSLSACDLFDIPALTAIPFAPAVSAVPFTNTPMSPVLISCEAQSSTPTLGWTQDCALSLPRQERPEAQWIAYPQPASDIVRLEGPYDLPAQEPVILHQQDGRVVRKTTYGQGIRMEDLAPGVYFLELPLLGKSIRVARQ